MRYFIEFSYNGLGYHGWQNQPNAISVQEVMEKALSALLRDNITVLGAGRTDAGVHAKQMYAHFDTLITFDFQKLIFRLNAFLPNDIVINNIRKVKPDAHARFDALERTYEYWMVTKKSPFLFHSAHCVLHPLDIESMNKAAATLIEYNNFKSFSKSNTDVKTYLCDVREAFWSGDGGKWVFKISADRFLRNMVRAIVGTLLEVGTHKIKPEDIKTIIDSGNRSKAGASVPAKGLYLTKVTYPETIFE